MKLESTDLGTLQRWMQAVLMHPAGVEAGISSEGARAEIDINADQLESVVGRSIALPAVDRLAVYCNAYYARLLECLREEFHAVAHALGEELFDEFSLDYLQTYPSRSYTLNELGANFPRFLAETCPTDEDPIWATFLIELAKLERIFGEVFDGPGVEGKELLTAERLLEVPPDRWLDAKLIPAAGLRLVELRAPVHEYIRAVKRKEDPAPPAPAETLLAVHRRDYVVRRHEISRPQFEMLSALVEGDSIGDAISRVLETTDQNADALAEDLRVWFFSWASEGLFQSVSE